jgi:hypothetical protein
MPSRPLTFRDLAFRVGLTAAAAASLTGCQSIQGTSATSPEVRLVDASPTTINGLGLDFYLNQTPEAYNLGPMAASNYIPIATGTYTASVKADTTTQTLASAGFTAAASQHYTILAGNIAAALELTVIQDQSTPSPSGSVNIRILDQSQSSGAVDIYFVPQGGKLTTTNPSIQGLTFDANSGYISVPAGTYEIVVVPTGTIPISTTVTLITGAQTTYAAGDALTLVLLDNPNVTTPAVQLDTLKPYDFGS